MDKTPYSLRINGVLLTKARIRAGLSMDDLVKLMGDGCNKSSISRWERGEMKKTTDDRIERLAEVLGTRSFIIKRSLTLGAIDKRNKLIRKLYAGGKGYSKGFLSVMFKTDTKTLTEIINKE